MLPHHRALRVPFVAATLLSARSTRRRKPLYLPQSCTCSAAFPCSASELFITFLTFVFTLIPASRRHIRTLLEDIIHFRNRCLDTESHDVAVLQQSLSRHESTIHNDAVQCSLVGNLAGGPAHAQNSMSPRDHLGRCLRIPH